MTFVDMHTHLPAATSPDWARWRQADVLAAMDRHGVTRAAVMTLDGLGFDAVAGNDVVAQACAGSDGRLIPLGTVDPRRPDAAAEVHRCADRGFRALKLHPWMQGFSPLEAYMDPVAEAAIEHGLPFVVHDGTPPYASPLQIARLAARFPELTVVLAHGGLFDLWEDAVAAALRYPNVHVTMCGTAPGAIFRQIVAQVPVEKLSLGTDSGFGDPDLPRHRLSVHRAILAELPGDDAAALAHRNAERLLGLP
ncbi:amidohydrolase family protein [Jiangella mangrovi]|uniref:Putative TIM-barrel fold metal-dependent hydrolase n=1 Tax=Jiangella mangrovi TaxID=1524084 RepID=A0A7W9LPE8_9ACTN|nr:amidohydrolase family protein [Jiangella mangrovi]MBB5791204.1 putative TIM-barrel fold metal-dependent hydrolase [Jiangella mangrovi]